MKVFINLCQADAIDQQLDSEHYGYSSSPCEETSRRLKMVSDLFKDDISNAVAALQTCTEELVSRLKEYSRKNLQYYYPRSSTPLTNSSDDEAERGVALAGGITPRPFR